MSKERLVPKRRFKGFEEEWETKSLLDIGNIVMGHSPKSINYTSNPNDHILVQGNADIKNHRIHPRLWTTEITQTAKKGDIILTVRAPVGEVAKTNYEVVLGRGVSAIEGNEYLFQYLLKLKANNYWGKLSSGSTFDSINSDDIKNLIINIPNIGEQQKIGRFFKLLDKRIANQEGKIAKLKDIKSAYLTEMFPKEGETVPKRRFKGFEGEWREVFLSEITNIKMGHSPKSINYTNNSSDHVLVQGNADIKNNKIIPRLRTKEITQLAKEGEIILTVRAPVGEVAKTDFNVVLGRGVSAIEGNEFLFQYLLKLKANNYWKKLSTGSTFDSINSEDIKNLIIKLPCNKEQQKIGSFFKNLDNQIETEEKKLAKLKAMKEAYLEEMFV